MMSERESVVNVIFQDVHKQTYGKETKLLNKGSRLPHHNQLHHLDVFIDIDCLLKVRGWGLFQTPYCHSKGTSCDQTHNSSLSWQSKPPRYQLGRPPARSTEAKVGELPTWFYQPRQGGSLWSKEMALCAVSDWAVLVQVEVQVSAQHHYQATLALSKKKSESRWRCARHWWTSTQKWMETCQSPRDCYWQERTCKKSKKSPWDTRDWIIKSML